MNQSLNLAFDESFSSIRGLTTSIFDENGGSDRDQIEKIQLFLKYFSDFDCDYENPITTSRT
jgi:hypothetical protein